MSDDLMRELRSLHNEVDCRIEHGAESGGHLEYVRTALARLLEHGEDVAEPRAVNDGR